MHATIVFYSLYSLDRLQAYFTYSAPAGVLARDAPRQDWLSPLSHRSSLKPLWRGVADDTNVTRRRCGKFSPAIAPLTSCFLQHHFGLYGACNSRVFRLAPAWSSFRQHRVKAGNMMVAARKKDLTRAKARSHNAILADVFELLHENIEFCVTFMSIR